MSSKLLYNNIGISALSIGFVLTAIALPVSKAVLILPIVSHRELLNYLSHRASKIKGLEQLIIEKTSCFSNFNKRYYDNFHASLNAIQLLNEIELIQIKDGVLIPKCSFGYSEPMGNRAEKIHKAARNIALILTEKVENLYLNLRIEL